MDRFQFAQIVNEDGSVRRLQYPVAVKYRESLKENLHQLAEDLQEFPEEPSHLNYNSTQLNRHLRRGETPCRFLPRPVSDSRVQLTPYFRWKVPELRGGNHFSNCLCMKRNGMQVWCPRWGCRGSLQCVSGRPFFPREHGQPLEPSCCESWLQRAKEADLQLYLMKKTITVPRGLY